MLGGDFELLQKKCCEAQAPELLYTLGALQVFAFSLGCKAKGKNACNFALPVHSFDAFSLATLILRLHGGTKALACIQTLIIEEDCL